MKKSIFFLISLFFLFSTSIFAGEGGGEKGKGVGGEYYKHVMSLSGLNSKIEKGEEDIRNLVDQKNKAKDDTEVRNAILEIKKGLQDRKKNIEKYNKELAITEYQFPDKGKEIKTKYKHFDESRVKQFEDKVNKLLSNVLSDVKDKYDPSK